MDIGQLSLRGSAKILSGHIWTPVPSLLYPQALFPPAAGPYPLPPCKLCPPSDHKHHDQWALNYPGGASTSVRSLWSEGQTRMTMEMISQEDRKAWRATGPAALYPAGVKNDPGSTSGCRHVMALPSMHLHTGSHDEGLLPSACVSNPISCCCSCWLSLEYSGF